MARDSLATSRSQIIVDPAARSLADATGNLIGNPRAFIGRRQQWALQTGASGRVRYLPDHPPAEVCNFGMDFSFVIPFGVGISSGTLAVFTNTAIPAASTDFTLGPVEVVGRSLYANVAGGVEGTDYQFRWTAYDTQNGVWPRLALVLCAQTS